MTETQTAEVRRDHSTLLQAFIELGNEVLGLREEYQKALGQVDAAREELAATRITLTAVQRERDEARANAEVWEQKWDSAVEQWADASGKLVRENGELRQERDEALSSGVRIFNVLSEKERRIDKAALLLRQGGDRRDALRILDGADKPKAVPQ